MPDNRKGFASALHIRGLRQRWMFSAVLPILLLLVLAVALFSVGVQEYYYNAMRSGLESRARIAAETFTGYGVKSYSEYYRLASYSAETFEEKDTIELQFINTNGRVQVSSYGLTASMKGGSPTALLRKMVSSAFGSGHRWTLKCAGRSAAVGIL